MRTELEKIDELLREAKDTLFFNASVTNVTYEEISEALKIVRELKAKLSD